VIAQSTAGTGRIAGIANPAAAPSAFRSRSFPCDTPRPGHARSTGVCKHQDAKELSYSTSLNRRNFVKATVLASAGVPLGASAEQLSTTPPASQDLCPSRSSPCSGKIGNVGFSRLVLGATSSPATRTRASWVTWRIWRSATTRGQGHRNARTGRGPWINASTVGSKTESVPAGTLEARWQDEVDLPGAGQPNGDFGQVNMAVDLVQPQFTSPAMSPMPGPDGRSTLSSR